MECYLLLCYYYCYLVVVVAAVVVAVVASSLSGESTAARTSDLFLSAVPVPYPSLIAAAVEQQIARFLFLLCSC